MSKVYTEPTHQSAILCLDTLLEEIYRLRVRLYELSRDVGSLSNPRLVEVSQQLDQKLNNYEQLKIRKTC